MASSWSCCSRGLRASEGLPFPLFYNTLLNRSKRTTTRILRSYSTLPSAISTPERSSLSAPTIVNTSPSSASHNALKKLTASAWVSEDVSQLRALICKRPLPPLHHLWQAYLSARTHLDYIPRSDLSALLRIFTNSIAYGKHDSRTDLAVTLFEDLDKRGVKFTAEEYSLWMRTYRAKWALTRAIRVMERMKHERVSPTRECYTALVDMLARSGHVEQANQLFIDMKAQGIKPSFYIYALLAEAHLKGNNKYRAWNLCWRAVGSGVLPIDEYLSRLRARRKEFSSWSEQEQTREILNFLVRALVLEDNLVEARRMYKLHTLFDLTPSEALLEALIHSHIQRGQIKKGLDLVLESRRNNIRLTHDVIESLLKKSIALEDLAVAEKLYQYVGGASFSFSEHACRDLIALHLRRKNAIGAMRVFGDLRNKHFPNFPATDTANILLRGLIQSARFDDARRLFDTMRQQSNFTPNAAVYITLIHFCARSGDVVLAERMVRQMREKRIPLTRGCYTMLMDCYARVGRMDGAMEMLRTLVQRGHKPTVTEFNILLAGCAIHPQNRLIGDMGVADIAKVLEAMQQYNVKPDLVTYRTLITTYLKYRDQPHEQVEDMIRELERRQNWGIEKENVFMFNIRLTYKVQVEGVPRAVQFFFEHAKAHPNFAYDVITYRILLDVTLKQHRLAYLSNRLYRHMLNRGLQLPPELMNQLIYSWAAKKRFKKARNLLEGMGEFADVRSWTGLIRAYLKYGYMEAARKVCEDMEASGVKADDYLMRLFDEKDGVGEQ
ncbi:uncharacterized protein VTP21DRAFT_5299 [Calcarisporiella thermophila]|uniref:uncharacterized protein n=1 Tax=Calcarisporiella thermophila TaxID=911321 RepID=UPI003741F21C